MSGFLVRASGRPTVGVDPDLYPDLAAAGSLAAALERAAAELAIDVSVVPGTWETSVSAVSPPPVPFRRPLSVGLAAETRLFLMHGRSRGGERGTAAVVDLQWRMLREQAASEPGFPEFGLLVAAAHAEPRLRQLSAFASHWTLGFSACTGPSSKVAVALAPAYDGRPYRVKEFLHEGVQTTGTKFFPQLWSFLVHLPDADPPTVVFSAAVLVFLFVTARYARAVPGPLVAVVLGTTAVVAFDLDGRYGLKVIGEVPSGLPALAIPDLVELPRLVLPALGVLLVAYTDFILTARAFTGRDDEGPGLDANQEFLALGAANLGAGALHGFPVSSSASRTALAASAGARSQAYSMVAGAVVLAVLLFLSPLPTRTPAAVLGALVVYAAARMIDLAGFRRLASFRRRELLLALGCLAGVLALDILYGVIVAVGLSVAELLTRVARPHDAVEGLVPGVAGMHDVDDYPTARTIPGLLVYRYDSPLFFANAEDFRRRALAAVDEQTDPVRWFVLNTEANVEVDITALDAVDELRRDLTHRGVVFALALVRQDLLDDLEAYGLADSVGTDRIFPTLPTAVAAYRTWLGRQ